MRCMALSHTQQAAAGNRAGRTATTRPDTIRRARVMARPAAAQDRLVADAPDSMQRLPLLSRVSACVEVNDLVASYETFAGRSAMVGVAVAAFVELVTEQGVFYSLTAHDLAVFGWLVLAFVSASAGLGYASKQAFGAKFKESVVTSLTAVRRSASSVSQRRVDKAVDYLFDEAFGLAALYTLLDEELL